MAAPQSEHTVSVGGLKIGVYHFKRSSESGKPGFHVCSEPEAEAGALGSQDPDQSSRIGFSETRTGRAAVASAAGDTSPLDEEQRIIAQLFTEALSLELKKEGFKGELAHPERDLGTAFDEQVATSLTLERPIADNNYPLIPLRKIMDRVAQGLNETKPWVKKEEPAAEVQKPAATPKSYTERKFEAIAIVLGKHFPGDENSKARAAATAALMSVPLITAKRKGITEDAGFEETKLGNIRQILATHFPDKAHTDARVKATDELGALHIASGAAREGGR